MSTVTMVQSPGMSEDEARRRRHEVYKLLIEIGLRTRAEKARSDRATEQDPKENDQRANRI